MLGIRVQCLWHWLYGLLVTHSWMVRCVLSSTHILWQASAEDSDDKFSDCPIRPKYWKTWIKRHFSGLCLCHHSVLGFPRVTSLEAEWEIAKPLVTSLPLRQLEEQQNWNSLHFYVNGRRIQWFLSGCEALFMQPLQDMAVPMWDASPKAMLGLWCDICRDQYLNDSLWLQSIGWRE